jgi:chloramphenicol 3-O-phosphotransferase
MNHGIIIILNGTSSSGKTGVLHALQDLLEEPYLEAGIDKLFLCFPKDTSNAPCGTTC